jgi:hypothetical protein
MMRGAIHLKTEDWIVAATVVSLLASAYAIIKPNRPFLHYFNLMIVPAGLLYAVLYIYWARDVEPGRWRRILLVGTFLFVSIGLVNTTRTNGVFGPHPVLDDLALIPATFGGKAASAIASVTRPGELMSVWGMSPGLFYDTGLVPSNDPLVAYLGVRPVQEEDFMPYIQGLEQSMPPVFVDAVGPGRFWLEDRSRTGHEVVPPLRDLVANQYKLLYDIEGYRVYMIAGRANALLAGLR